MTADTSVLDGVKFYKIVGAQGESVHGGSLTWALPTADAPGAWHQVEGPIEACARGLHLTPLPIEFYVVGSRVFEAEWRGEIDASRLTETGAEKVAVSECRLRREADWSEFCVWFDGEHEVREGCALAYDSATVEAYGSATVRASGSATVRAYGSATVEAYGSASVISTIYHSRSATVALANLAAHIDRRESGKVTLRQAEVVA